MHLLVIIPTYNEAENIGKLLPLVAAVIPPMSGILIVDDNSPDDTAQAARTAAQKISGVKIEVLERTKKDGLGPAYIAGFRRGMERGYDAFLEMDADFSHRPEDIPALCAALETHDVAVGSRYVKGGGIENWSLLRKIISRGGSLYARWVLGIKIRDLTGGFNMWRLSALEKIGLENILSRGYLFQIEMKARAVRAGCTVCEIPIIFPDRTAGESKMSGGIFREAVLGVWKLKYKIRAR